MVSVADAPAPVYVSPTPASGLHKQDPGYIVINVSDSSSVADSVQVYISGANYTATYDAGGNYYYYNYSTNLTSSKQTLSFEAFYYLSGSNYSIGSRTITLYSEQSSSSTVGAFHPLLFMVLVMVYFFWR